MFSIHIRKYNKNNFHLTMRIIIRLYKLLFLNKNDETQIVNNVIKIQRIFIDTV